MKKIKHINLKSLRNKVWSLQSEYIRRLENGICFTCGVHKPWKETDCGHYIHKNCLDFEPINLHCQCSRCNRFLHGNLGVYAERMIAEYGEMAIAVLRERAKEIKKFTIKELQDKLGYYKTCLSELSAGRNNEN